MRGLDLNNAAECLSCPLPLCVYDDDSEIPHHFCPIEAKKRGKVIKLMDVKAGEKQCKKCGEVYPLHRFITTQARESGRCDGCRKRQGQLAWTGRRAKTEGPTADLVPGSRSAVSRQNKENGSITLVLSSAQAEKMLELTMREIVTRHPDRLVEKLPMLLEMLIEGGSHE